MLGFGRKFWYFLTAKNVRVHLPHSQIVQSHYPIDAARHDLVPQHVETAHAVPALLQHLNRFGRLALAIPDPYRRIKASYTTKKILSSFLQLFVGVPKRNNRSLKAHTTSDHKLDIKPLQKLPYR